MVRKKVDSRIRTLIENNVKEGHRSLFLMVGDKGKEQVVNLHFILAKAQLKTRPSVLWCYKKDLGFSSNRKKRERQIKKDIRKGLRSANENDPFELFVTSTNIRYCYYKDTASVLGQTYGMLVLSDFQSLTPNLLARTVETVEGGGIVVILLKTMNSLKQLYQLSMDVHKRYRTQSHGQVVGRFNERFILSLGSCQSCLAVDDELNVLPLSSKNKHIEPIFEAVPSQNAVELKELKTSMKDTDIISELVSLCLTLDQAKCVLTFVESIMDKTLRNTVMLTAARGRGKSAALGISAAAAVAYGYSNIFVTSPSPENLGTVFQLLISGLKSLGFKEHSDYTIVQSSNPDFNKAIIRVNIFRDNRQTIQYIAPQDHHLLGTAEILIVDEAAAIPIPVVKKLFGPYLIFMSSTINGYEGTGRSLSLKLIKNLKKSSEGKRGGGRLLKEIQLKEPIRYKENDAVEKWLTDLLCLDCTGQKHHITQGTPSLESCQLFYINKDTLFSRNAVSEKILQRMMSLYVSSHYKNSPNDLLLMSDNPAHHLFCLLGPRRNDNEIPDLLVVIQVCLEGELSKASVEKSLIRGKMPSGDMIPWCTSQQFQDSEFGRLSGVRIVRIATHPDVLRMKYGTRAIQLLGEYYGGKLSSVHERIKKVATPAENQSSSELKTETLSPRVDLPPILTEVSQRTVEKVHWMGVSYGLTQNLFLFWKKAGFESIYLRQSSNSITGEHTIIMLKSICGNGILANDWLQSYTSDFRRRLMSLSSIAFRNFSAKLSLIVLNPDECLLDGTKKKQQINFTYDDLSSYFTPWDLGRLEAYSKKRTAYQVIIDLVPKLAKMFFSVELDITMNFTQCAILNAFGFQHKSVEEISKDLRLPVNQILALFTKMILKFVKYFNKIEHSHERKKIEKETTSNATENMKPVKESLEDEMKTAAKEAMQTQKRKNVDVISKLKLSEFQINESNEDWKEALKENEGTSVSIPNKGTKRKRDGKGEGTKKKKKKKKSGLKKKKKKEKN